MSYKAGTIHNDNLFVRCPYCGDSQSRLYIGHLSIKIEDGLYYCFRCGVSGKLSLVDFIDVLAQYNIECPETVLYDTLRDETYTSGTNYQDNRYSLLERRTDNKGNVTVAMRDVHGNITGYQHRTSDKRIQTEGIKGYGYVGNSLVNTDYIRLVEGPYDVVYDNDVCVFGSLSYGMVQRLKLYTLLLAPDADVIRQRSKLQSFVRMVYRLLVKGYNIKGVEIFEKGYDPGRAYEENRQRKVLSAGEFVNSAKQKLQSDTATSK
jgi:hypothetical protein